VYKVMKSFICRGCSNPVTSTGHTSVVIDTSANLEVWISSATWVTCWVSMEMLMQLWKQEPELDGINSGSSYPYLPLGI